MNWYLQSSEDCDVVKSSRIRLARNLNGFKFNLENKSEIEQLENKIKDNLYSIGYGLKYLKLKDMDDITKMSLVEKNLISPEFALNKSETGSILINDEENICIMIGGKDHINIQVFNCGLDLENTLNLAIEIDKKIEDLLGYAINNDNGLYLLTNLYDKGIYEINTVQDCFNSDIPNLYNIRKIGFIMEDKNLNYWRNLKKDYAKINHQIIDNEYIYTKEIKNDFEKLIRNYHLEKLVNISDFGNIGDCIKDNSFKFENQINFYNAVTLYKIIKLKWPNDWDIFKIFNNFTDKEMIIKAEHKYKFKCISACTFLLLIYLIFVIPLILMLFK